MKTGRETEEERGHKREEEGEGLRRGRQEEEV